MRDPPSIQILQKSGRQSCDYKVRLMRWHVNYYTLTCCVNPEFIIWDNRWHVNLLYFFPKLLAFECVSDGHSLTWFLPGWDHMWLLSRGFLQGLKAICYHEQASGPGLHCIHLRIRCPCRQALLVTLNAEQVSLDKRQVLVRNTLQ